MTLVRLDDNRTPGGQSRRGIAADDGEGEREVAGGEYGDGTAGLQHPPQVRTPDFRGRLRDDHVEVLASFDERGEQPQLAGRAGQLAS